MSHLTQRRMDTQQEQCPQQRGTVVLPGLGIGAKGTSIVIANHYNQSWSENCQQSLQLLTEGATRMHIVVNDSAKSATDVVCVGAVTDSSRR